MTNPAAQVTIKQNCKEKTFFTQVRICSSNSQLSAWLLPFVIAVAALQSSVWTRTVKSTLLYLGFYLWNIGSILISTESIW